MAETSRVVLSILPNCQMNFEGSPEHLVISGVYMAILNENGTGVAGAPPPSLVLANLCWLIK